ncbi:MAG: 50S ribosomal protein L22 [Cyanobium sp. MAG06]|nr:50S ribosomal protein L22 [Cyanobium sp. MAG06]
MKAIIKNYRQSPRKVRLIADLIKGKTAKVALHQLELLIKRGSEPMKKLLENAINNSKMSPEDLIVESVRVDGGLVMKRFMPRAMGRATQILKRTSHIQIQLKEKNNIK